MLNKKVKIGDSHLLNVNTQIREYGSADQAWENKICGYVHNATYIFHYQRTEIWFHTDANGVDRGFHIKYSSALAEQTGEFNICEMWTIFAQ